MQSAAARSSLFRGRGESAAGKAQLLRFHRKAGVPFGAPGKVFVKQVTF